MKRFYVVGNPINHSLSPKLFTYIFNKLNIKAEYLSYMPDSVNNLQYFLKNKRNTFHGLNITLPYKIDIFNSINKHDAISAKIKSTNCINNNNNQLMGYNTDYYGFNKMFNKINIDNVDILILGNGGLARTVAYSLLDSVDNTVYIWGRNKTNVDFFINSINDDKLQFYSKKLISPHIVINCLPFNIEPKDIDSVIDNIFSSKVELFVDLNYMETLFTKTLTDKKYDVILGLDMFIFQALKSFDIWFDNKYHNKISYKEIQTLLNK